MPLSWPTLVRPAALCFALFAAVLPTGLSAQANGAQVRVGSRFRVHVPGLIDAAKKLGRDSLRVYIGGYQFAGVHGVPVGRDTLEFKLDRNDSTKATWLALYQMVGVGSEGIRVAVGSPHGELPAEAVGTISPDSVAVQVLSVGAAWGGAALTAVLLFLIWGADRRYGLLREAPRPEADKPKGNLGELPGKPNENPFSLGMVQMAFWFAVIMGCFSVLACATGDVNGIMTEQALILMGIGTGTALGSAVVRDTKRSAATRDLALIPGDAATSLRQQIDWLNLGKPARESGWGNLLRDLLTTADGLAFHRFQILVITLILGIVFVVAVVRTLAFPVFDSTLLAMMGISGGTYLGFNVSELN